MFMKAKGKNKSKIWARASLPGTAERLSTLVLAGAAASAVAVGAPTRAHAYSLYNGTFDDNVLTIDLDTTVEYSNIFRLNKPSKIFLNDPNGNEGDSNFRHGLVSNEFEVLPVYDAKYGNFGVHFSGEAYLNTVYLQHNQGSPADEFNPISTTSTDSFTSATRNTNGENAKLLDAFGYGSKYFGANDAQELSLKFGRQTLLWGQSLLFASDGISAGQAPIDIQVAQTTPNAQAQQVFLPVGQVVLTYQPNETYTIQGYYQFEWEPDNFQGVGSYFSSADILDKGGQTLLLGQALGLPPVDAALYRVKDLRPPINNGQFGLSVQATYGNYDIGVFAERYDSKAPEIYSGAPSPQHPESNNFGSYWLVYPRDIQLYGTSISSTLFGVNVAGEVSYRRHAPLVESASAGASAYPGNANANPAYPVGDVVNTQVSMLYSSPPLPFDPGGLSLLAEYDMNSVTAVQRNTRAALDTSGRQPTAGAFEFVLTPTYFFTQIPNVQFNFPIGLEEGLFNRSEFDGTENHGTGEFNAGVTAIYKQTWTAGLVYQDYIGAPNENLQGDASIADRGYVGFNVEHTF
jgi:hypothetical protein